ncbi:Fe-S protein assembly co-chaperone HscB [Aquabacterium sp. J223]|uniref:Fe-S protein assembly co-chaperone HscB n=1 Tax=Aquabacterium sp. J223 TaxID=2898431 RepID=UPI0021ADF7F9|nr:Fe-S protein assembly co-chaperone HscB [Aquabacterium sp. J223]UUX97648.1 Fe-S protein assembly co-chaperone HscB [Aquabacterium sp. J223]
MTDDLKLDDDDFTLFGLPRRFTLDPAQLEERRRVLQAATHPDRFASQGAAAQRVAMQWAVRVNEAHRRLKDPVARAALLCELAGVPIDAERNTAMPAEFLVQQMAWREALEEAADVPAVEALDDQVAAFEREVQANIARLLDQQGDARAAAERVRALMFVARFRSDVEKRLDALGQ